MNSIKTILFAVAGSIIVLAVLIFCAFWQGQKYERKDWQLKLAQAVDVVKVVDLPPIIFPEKKGRVRQSKPDTAFILVRLVADSLTIDSLQRESWLAKESRSFSASDSVVAEDSTVVNYKLDVTMPYLDPADYSLMIYPMRHKEKEIERLVPTPFEESWTVHPLYAVGGAIAGVAIYIISTH